MSLRRISAIVRRHYYLYKGSWPRVLDLFYWPVMSLALWGFLSLYLKQLNLNLPAVVPVFLGALILWDVLFRAEIGVCIAFLEEVWSRNLVGIFVSPLSPFEFVIAQVLVGVLRTSFATCIMIVIAALAYHFNIFDMGLYLVGFFVNLIIMGWSIGWWLQDSSCVSGRARKALHGPSFSFSSRSLPYFIPSRRFLHGFSPYPGPRRPPVFSRACAPC